MREEARQWFDRAEQDLDDAVYAVDGGREKLAAFLFQQFCEKALKASLIEKNGSHPRTHNLVRLGKELDTPSEYDELFEDLTPIYTGCPYPDGATTPPQDIEDTARRIKAFRAWMKHRLTEETAISDV